MNVSHESDAEIDSRLRTLISLADFVSYDDAFVFVESPVTNALREARADAVAMVRDDDVWSELVPAAGTHDIALERCALFRFHFPPGVDNSGFVGWLAAHLKRELGTGVFVVCGQNSRRGGIYDYWGCPMALRDETRRVIDALRADGSLSPS